MKKKKKKDIQVGDKVYFHSGNFNGLHGIIKQVDLQSTHPRAIYGIWITVELSDGRIGYINKSEHWEFA